MGAVRGLVQSLLSLLRDNEVTHIGCAFDSVIPSFRNEMFPGYKTGEGTPEDLLAQFPLAERAVSALGVCVWPMVEFEADDAIASAVAQLTGNDEVERITICSPDKDLSQLVEGERVVCLDRRRGDVIDEQGVAAKFGVSPESIPDLLALTGDTADGIPGLPRWGAKTSAAALAPVCTSGGDSNVRTVGCSGERRSGAARHTVRAVRRCAAVPRPGNLAPRCPHRRYRGGCRVARRTARRVRGAVRGAGLRPPRHGPPPLGAGHLTPRAIGYNHSQLPIPGKDGPAWLSKRRS